MATRLELRTLIRRRLGDISGSYAFSDEQINQWIADAMADYAIYFPSRNQADISAVAGKKEYDLPVDFRAIVSVEYPSGEDPKRYLERLAYTSLDFYLGEAHYDIIKRAGPGAPSELWISVEPQGGETIAVEYLGEYAYPEADNSILGIPDRHLELLVLFCRWAAYQELAMSESVDPDPSGLALSTMELNATRAERLYRKSVNETMKNESESGLAAWKMDGRDRVY